MDRVQTKECSHLWIDSRIISKENVCNGRFNKVKIEQHCIECDSERIISRTTQNKSLECDLRVKSN